MPTLGQGIDQGTALQVGVGQVVQDDRLPARIEGAYPLFPGTRGDQRRRDLPAPAPGSGNVDWQRILAARAQEMPGW